MTDARTLADLIHRAESKHPGVILSESGQTTCYQSLAEQIESLASELRRAGLQPGTILAQPWHLFPAIEVPHGAQHTSVGRESVSRDPDFENICQLLAGTRRVLRFESQ